MGKRQEKGGNRGVGADGVSLRGTMGVFGGSICHRLSAYNLDRKARSAGPFQPVGDAKGKMQLRASTNKS
jgi:hypothetical protein